jgi:hypothetical protein
MSKPLGQTRLPPSFDPPPGKRIGEVWFAGGGDLQPHTMTLLALCPLSTQSGHCRATVGFFAYPTAKQFDLVWVVSCIITSTY